MVHAIIKQQYYNTIVCRDIGKNCRITQSYDEFSGQKCYNLCFCWVIQGFQSIEGRSNSLTKYLSLRLITLNGYRLKAR